MAQEKAQPVLNAAGQYAAIAQEKAQPALNAAGQYAAIAQEKAQPALDAAKGYAVQAQQAAQPHVDQAMGYAAGVAQQAQLKTQEVVGQVCHRRPVLSMIESCSEQMLGCGNAAGAAGGAQEVEGVCTLCLAETVWVTGLPAAALLHCPQQS